MEVIKTGIPNYDYLGYSFLFTAYKNGKIYIVPTGEVGSFANSRTLIELDVENPQNVKRINMGAHPLNITNKYYSGGFMAATTNENDKSLYFIGTSYSTSSTNFAIIRYDLLTNKTEVINSNISAGIGITNFCSANFYTGSSNYSNDDSSSITFYPILGGHESIFFPTMRTSNYSAGLNILEFNTKTKIVSNIYGTNKGANYRTTLSSARLVCERNTLFLASGAYNDYFESSTAGGVYDIKNSRFVIQANSYRKSGPSGDVFYWNGESNLSKSRFKSYNLRTGIVGADYIGNHSTYLKNFEKGAFRPFSCEDVVNGIYYYFTPNSSTGYFDLCKRESFVNNGAENKIKNPSISNTKTSNIINSIQRGIYMVNSASSWMSNFGEYESTLNRYVLNFPISKINPSLATVKLTTGSSYTYSDSNLGYGFNNDAVLHSLTEDKVYFYLTASGSGYVGVSYEIVEYKGDE